MSAEVAVMNRSAVALAADSAGTLFGRDLEAGVEKVFQNETKLFELSQGHPVGVMLHLTPTFLGVPWEMIIRDFGVETGGAGSETVAGWADRFLKYLEGHPRFKPDPGQQREFVGSVLFREVNLVFWSWLEEMRPLTLERQPDEVKRESPRVLLRHINERVERYESAPFYEGFGESGAEGLLKLYRDEYQSAEAAHFTGFPLSEAHKTSLARLARGILSRAEPGSFTTGLVFAGYGTQELFPSLVSVEIGGVVGDRLRWTETRRAGIDRASTTAEIVPFAQRETLDSLLFGRSDRYEEHVLGHFSKAVTEVGKGLVEQLTRPGAKRAELEARVAVSAEALVANFRERHAPQLMRELANDTLDVVRHMSKPDLAAFAESLVTVSSMKRRVTLGPETVGGPVDVAVVSRSDGFVWVKRKRYFDAELNRRHAPRSFGSNDRGEGHAGARR